MYVSIEKQRVLYPCVYGIEIDIFYDHDRVRWIIHMYVYVLYILYIYLLKHRIHIHSDELAGSR